MKLAFGARMKEIKVLLPETIPTESDLVRRNLAETLATAALPENMPTVIELGFSQALAATHTTQPAAAAWLNNPAYMVRVSDTLIGKANTKVRPSYQICVTKATA
jgi:hypothetical protein